MPDHSSNQSASSVNNDILSRIIELRRRDCAALDKAVVAELVENETKNNDTKPPQTVVDPHEKLNWLIKENLNLAGNEKLVPSKRRQAWQRIKHLLEEIDKQCKPLARVSVRVSNRDTSTQTGTAAAAAVRLPSGPKTSTQISTTNSQQTAPAALTTTPLHRTNEMEPQASLPRAQGTSGGEGPHRFRAIISATRKEVHGQHHQRSHDKAYEPNRPTAKNGETVASKKPPPPTASLEMSSHPKPTPAPVEQSSAVLAKPQTVAANTQPVAGTASNLERHFLAQNGSNSATLSRKQTPGPQNSTSTTNEAQQTVNPSTATTNDTQRISTAFTSAGPNAAPSKEAPPPNTQGGTSRMDPKGPPQNVPTNGAKAAASYASLADAPRPLRPPLRPPLQFGHDHQHQSSASFADRTDPHNYYGPPQTTKRSSPQQDTSHTRRFQAPSSTRAVGQHASVHSSTHLNNSRQQEAHSSHHESSKQAPFQDTSPTSAAKGPGSIASRWEPPAHLANRRTQGEGVRRATSSQTLERTQSEASKATFRAIGDSNPGNRKSPAGGSSQNSRAPSRTGQSGASRDASSGPSKNGFHTSDSDPGTKSPPSAAFTEIQSLRDIAEKQKAKRRTIELDFLADRVGDRKLAHSYALKERPTMRLKFNPRNTRIESTENLQNQVRRLEKWDPFWKFCGIVDIGMTLKVDSPQADAAKTAAVLKVDLNGILSRNAKALLSKVQWGKAQVGWKDGDVALILRMIPFSKDLKKRADCHLWPKGTFLEITGRENDEAFKKPIYLAQRKQQSHDGLLWKGMCKHLDLAQYIKQPSQAFNIQMCCYDDELFYYCLSFCEYRSPETLYSQMMSNAPLMTKLSREESTRKALSLASEQMVVLHSDDEKEEEEVGKFVFTLTCPISKTVMKTPVRGNSCKHFQCFDLQSFLESNLVVCGSRWRCASCERFIAWRDLQFCGLTDDLLKEFKGEASPQRDRIQFNSDRSYRLLEEAKKRYNGKKRAADGAQESKNAKQQSKKPKIADDEVIIL